MKKLILLLTIIPFCMDSKILEAKQLFNKKVVKVKKIDINEVKNYYATVKVDESKIKDISLRFDGFVEKLYIDKRYMLVKKGDKLFSIYSDEVSFLLKELKFKNNLSTKKRLKNLDILISEYQKSSNINIYTKYSGFILDKNIYDGSFIKKGKSIYKIADLSSIWVIAKVYQNDIKDLKNSTFAKIYIDGLGEFKTSIDFIYPNVDKQAKTVDVRFVLKNNDFRIYPNMFAKIKIFFKKKSALVLPKSAVFTKGKKHFVFLDKGSEFEPKEIKAKRINSYQSEVKGLTEGIKVIDKVMFMLDSDALINSLYDSIDEDW